MSSARTLTSLRVTLAAVAIGGSTLAAQSPVLPVQSPARGTALIVPITAVADLGGLFSGALLIERFAAQGNGIVATGIATGSMTVNGTFRNLVIPLALPLDIAASRARSNTDPALAQSACDVLHVELGGTTINILGLNIGVNPVAFDLASIVQSPGAQPPATTQGTAVNPSVQSGTVTASPSANATQLPAGSSSTPGVVPAPQTAAAPAQTPFAALLCSVDRFRDASNATQTAQQLNAILSALGAQQGP